MGIASITDLVLDSQFPMFQTSSTVVDFRLSTNENDEIRRGIY